MELNYEAVTTPLRSAATVMLLRDSSAGLELFLLKRHGLSDVLGGAYVFPGGKVDGADAELDADAHLDQAPPVLHASLNEPEIDAPTASGLYVAAIREAFEECGILFAHGASQAQATGARVLSREGYAFDEVLAQMQLRLQTQSLSPWSRWITPRVPSVMNKRFDTRFFVAACPPDQVASHDNHEAIESLWITPREALEQYRSGQIELAPPQIMSLAHLSRLGYVQTVMAEAKSRPPSVIQPEPFDDDGSRVICYPGDARHSVRVRAMPGPTRLRYVKKRFEPMEGFDALFN